MENIEGSHWNYSDEELLTILNNEKLNPKLFKHETHIRVSWTLLKDNALPVALDRICSIRLAYTSHLGAEEKFHKTLTAARAYAVFHFKRRSKSTKLKSFLLEYPQLKYEFKELISSHYSSEALNCIQAQERYIHPDLSPFYHLT